MQQSEELIYRDRCILKILLQKRSVSSSVLRESFDISKSTLSECLKRLRTETGFDIRADKSGTVYLEGDDTVINDYLTVCSYEPIGIHRITEWTILFVMRAEDRELTFNELYSCTCDFFGSILSVSSFRKRLNHLVNCRHVEVTNISNNNNTYFFGLSYNAPVFIFMTQKNISFKKSRLVNILKMYEEQL